MLHIRPATPADVPSILGFIRDLAAYERSLHHALATEADLLRDGFSLSPDGQALPTPARFRALMADWQQGASDPSRPAGFVLFFTTYSTWVGHHGIRLEDIYVTPELRGQGLGKALLAELARIALDEGCSRLEWDVLTWNEPALGFYRRLGAATQEDWRIMRLSGEPLQALASPPKRR